MVDGTATLPTRETATPIELGLLELIDRLELIGEYRSADRLRDQLLAQRSAK